VAEASFFALTTPTTLSLVAESSRCSIASLSSPMNR